MGTSASRQPPGNGVAAQAAGRRGQEGEPREGAHAHQRSWLGIDNYNVGIEQKINEGGMAPNCNFTPIGPTVPQPG